MNILFCAAEQEELDCALMALRPYESKIAEKVKVDFLLTGIGTTSTCYSLTKKILEEQNKNNSYTLIINIGTAGSYDLEKYPIGSVVITQSQHSGDLGFMTKNGFKSLFDAKILNANLFPYKEGELIASELSPFFSEIFSDIPRVKGNTVQIITNDSKLIEQYKKTFDIESMEGAGVFYVCLNEHINFVELRAISNSVGEEDRDKWENGVALDAIYKSCKNFFQKLSGENN